MGKRWLASVLWCGIWWVTYVMVTPWGMYWAFTAAGLLSVAFVCLVCTTLRLVCGRRPVLAQQQPRLIRRVILEEELR
jgi:hypothetical protein